jgi:ribosomal protein S18 acetylase RimI-like enzyme
MIAIQTAENPQEIEIVGSLFRAYADELVHVISDCLVAQGFEDEVASLPGKYAPPGGCLLWAHDQGTPAGCVALRSLGDGACEIKRLYVAPEFRKRGVGRQLAEAVIARAKALGYDCIRLDSMAEMTTAIELYRTLGFVDIPPYWDNPVPHSVHMEKALGEPRLSTGAVRP